MAGLTLEIEQTQGGGVWQALLAFLTSVTGSPISSAVANEDGTAIADLYTLTFSSVVAGTSATVHVASASPDNPYGGQTHSVALDNSTVYSGIVPGVDLKFSSSGSFTGSWSATVRVGYSFGAQAGFGSDAGQPSVERRIRVTNSDSNAAQAVTASIAKRVILYPTAGQIFARVFAFADAATESISGDQVQPYHVTVANVTGSGGSKTMDVKVGGSTVNVENLTTPGSGVSTGLNVSDVYQITSGALTGVQFVLSENATNSDTANILIFDARYTQIAPDLGGAPGDWGTDDVVVTQDGQSDGVIQAGEVAYVWVRVLVTESTAISQSNPMPVSFQISAQQSSPAAWSA